MKRNETLLLFVFSTVILFSCKKQSANQESSSDFKTRIVSWLLTQKSPSQPNKAANINLLSESLVFSRATTEESHDGEKLLIIPIADSYCRQKNISRDYVATLVIKLNAVGEVRNGNIVLFKPRVAGNLTIPANTFYAIFNTAEPPVDGEFNFLSVSGRRLFSLTYENKAMIKESRVKEKGGKSRTDGTCTDWFLVTTIYYTDGTTEVTEDYIGTTCTGCDCGDLQCECPDDQGEGNSVGYDYDYEIGKMLTWTVASNPTGGTGQIVGQERLKGKRVATEPQGGHFTRITHYASTCNFCSINNPYDVWIEDSWTGSASGQTASSTVTGHLNYAGTRYDVQNPAIWSFSAVFP